KVIQNKAKVNIGNIDRMQSTLAGRRGDRRMPYGKDRCQNSEVYPTEVEQPVRRSKSEDGKFIRRRRDQRPKTKNTSLESEVWSPESVMVFLQRYCNCVDDWVYSSVCANIDKTHSVSGVK
ncbi:MAG: hypothetical protein ACYS9C_10770, partial [Planctomycetota bacterium]